MILNPYNKINITLCGMMGSGKSIIGKKLANKINFNFVDTDNLIEEKVGKSITEIFTENGESYFRKIEEKIIINILKKKNYVISLGGGSIINNNIRRIIKNNSYNIYLNVNIDILVKRLISSKKRPLIKNKDINDTLINLFNKRKKFYQKADLILNNENNINQTIINIIKKLKINEENY